MEHTVEVKLFMILLGCKPPGRHTEQHDIFFAIGESIAAIKNEIIDFWPEANGKIHIDAWREVNMVEGHAVKVVPVAEAVTVNSNKLFFINLGGYKEGEFDELHYKMLIVAGSMAEASRQAKETAFYKHMGFAGAVSHIDDKYGVDVDDIYEIADVLPVSMKQKFRIQIDQSANATHDLLHLGYLPLSKV
uniref:DUF1543 domain-containing protein n=1 Tax=Pedobacter schmidteae TaxID=2201271 RepID=UPI000EB1C1FB|nr:DUF1543 domain-containing protein [Pedobacter schmidteae]